MQIDAYREFTRLLKDNLYQKDDVLGLVAAGSMAEQDYQPDEWSDHDFFVITEAGVQNRYRQQYDWLPFSHKIIWAFQETEHGVKVIYDNGHLLEFAVFDEQELQMARSNRYRVLFDRGNISQQMAKIAERTGNGSDSGADLFHAGQFLTNILVGLGRYWRGEMLSAHKFVKLNAVHHLVTLLNRQTSSSTRSLVDNFDPTRRFEFLHPSLGVEMEKILLLPIPEAAEELLTLMKRELQTVISIIPNHVVTAIEIQIQKPNSSKIGTERRRECNIENLEI